MIDDQLRVSFDHVASVSGSSHLAIFSIRKIWQFVTQSATELLDKTTVIPQL